MRPRKLFIPLLCLLFACKKECPEPVEVPPPIEECKVELQKGLLAYYPFNGNANDLSGKGHNGIPKNGTFFTTDFLGRANRAVGFDGMDDYIMVEDSDSLTPANMTVSMMVLVNNTNRRHTFMNSVNFQTATAVNWGIGQSLDQTNKFDFAANSPNTNCNVGYVYDPANVVSSSENMVTGRWYQLIVTFGEGKQRMYVDGNLKASSNRNFQTLKQCDAANLIIGGYWANDIISIDGKMDEIRIYNRVLNDCELRKLSEIFIQEN